MTGSEQLTQRPECRGLEDRVVLHQRAAAEPAVLEHHLGALEIILSAHGADGRHGIHRRTAEIADVAFPGHVVEDIYGHDAAVGLLPRLPHFVRHTSVEDGIPGTLGGQFFLLLLLLLVLSFSDMVGVVCHLVNDIPVSDWQDAVQIVGWLYQYYNTEPKNAAFAKNGKITKEEIPAVTQLFTPDWIVRYMVENSLGRLWVEGRPECDLKENWKYYLEEARQEPEVQAKLSEIRKEYAALNPEDIKLIDPCMGSGHILVYAFDVLMQIFESAGYSQRDAAKSILEHNIYWLDIDDRAYQLAYFAVMMKARQDNRRILNGENTCHVYAIQESNSINRAHLKYFGAGMDDIEKNAAKMQLEGLLDTLTDAKEYGSILIVESYNWD